MIPSAWKDAVITYGTDPNNSAEVDLEGNYEFLTVVIPTLNSASATTVHISDASGGTFVPLYMFDTNVVGDFAQSTDDLTTAKVITYRTGGAQYIKVVCEDAQGANITFKVRGFNRG